MSTLYESILSLCTERGITGGKMCVDLGLSKSLMTDLKKNRKAGISAKTAQKIADYFGVTVGRVLGSEEDMSIELVQSTLSQSEIEAWKTIQQTASRVLGSDQKEKSPAPDGVGLTETQQKAWNLIQGMDEESLKKFIVIAQTVKGDL